MTEEPEPMEMEEELTVTITAPTKVDQGAEVEFESSVTGNPDSYTWTIPGSAASLTTEENTTVLFDDYGEYEISLTVTRDSDGATATATSTITVCLTDGLIAYYPLDGDANDNGPNGFDGTVNGASNTNNLNGDANTAMSFDGEDDYVAISAGIDNLFNTGASFSFWVNLGETGTSNRMLANYNGDSPGGDCLQRVGFNFALTDTEGIRLSYASDGNDYIGRISDGGLLTVGEWHHVVGTWNTELVSEGITLHIDGNRVDTENFEGGFICDDFIASDAPFSIGRTVCAAGPCAYFTGSIDEVRFFDRVITEDEINFLGN